jgi:F-type H+-transporting ATPase subunit epsilon
MAEATGEGTLGGLIHLEVVTRTGVALRADVDEVQAPSVQGEFGVLPGHLPLLAAIKSGVLSYRSKEGTRRAVIGPGFAEAGPDKVLILTEHFVDQDDIDPDATRDSLEKARNAVEALREEGITQGARVDEQLARIEWCEAQLAMVELWRPGHRPGTGGGEPN